METADIGGDEPELHRPSTYVALPSIVTSENGEGCVVDDFLELHTLKNTFAITGIASLNSGV